MDACRAAHWFAEKSMIVIFILLSILDFILSTTLLIRCGPDVERNIVARWVYTNVGVFGLALFKAVMVTLVVQIVGLIKRDGRPRTAVALQFLACTAVGVAVLMNVCCLFILGG